MQELSQLTMLYDLLLGAMGCAAKTRGPNVLTLNDGTRQLPTYK